LLHFYKRKINTAIEGCFSVLLTLYYFSPALTDQLTTGGHLDDGTNQKYIRRNIYDL